MERKKEQNGITIIALVITIVVLIILASISIKMLIGDNGVIKEAKNSKTQVEISMEKENIDISILELLLKKTNRKIEITDKNKFEQILRKNYNNEKINVIILEMQAPVVFEVKYLETKRSYYVTVDGKVSETIGKKLVIEYKTSKGNEITKKIQEYTKETITIGKLELSEEIKNKNNYEFLKAEILKTDGSIINANITDKVTLDESINKITIIYTQKVIYTLTINSNGGVIVGETTKKGTEGKQEQIPTPTPPSGYTVRFDGNGGTVSPTALETSYSFRSWSLSGGGSISGNTYTFGNQDATITALYTHRGITLPGPTREGYTFKGWYTSSTGTTKVGDAGSTYIPTGNTTIYAKWEAQIPSLITDFNVWFTPDITTWTNQDVNVSVRTSETKWSLQLTTGNPLEEDSWTTTNRITVEENGTIYARLTDGYTSGGYASYNITNIDKTPPRKLIYGNMAIRRHIDGKIVILDLERMQELESGVASIYLNYKIENEINYTRTLVDYYVPMYGSETGIIMENGNKTYSINNDKFVNQTVQMYAEIWDVAGNLSKTWLATISPDGKQTSYTEI